MQCPVLTQRMPLPDRGHSSQVACLIRCAMSGAEPLRAVLRRTGSAVCGTEIAYGAPRLYITRQESPDVIEGIGIPYAAIRAMRCPVLSQLMVLPDLPLAELENLQVHARNSYATPRQNQIQAAALSAQFVPGMRLFAFDYAVYAMPVAVYAMPALDTA
eukprot:362586-Rhodomonas_salina.1